MRLLAQILGLILIAVWAIPSQALERRPYPFGMLPNCLGSESKPKDKNRLFPPDLLQRDKSDTAPPTYAEKQALWKQIIERALYNRIKGQPEFATLGQQKLECEIEYTVSVSGNVESPRIKKPSANFSFDALVIKCLKSLRKERVLNFPTGAGEEQIQLSSLIVYPMKTQAINEVKASYLYRLKSRSTQKITNLKAEGKCHFAR